jgi:hypothetical protein
MDNDQRDRREWPDSDTPAEPPDDAAEPTPPSPDWESATPAADEPPAAAAEFESWPSQDGTPPDEAPAAEGGAEAAPAEETFGAADERDEMRAWPTEPPAAGTAPEESWPTSAPERGDEPVLEPAPDEWSSTQAPPEEPAPGEPPPAEVEAYPSSESGAPPLPASAAAAAGARSVPDTEAATGESTQCPRCGTENRPGLAFCRNCGQRLVAAGVAPTIERPGTPEGTIACPRCGTHNRMGVAFCQNCGANLRGTAPGYVPPTVVGDDEAAAPAVERRGAVLGPIVLLIGMVGLITGYLLPFLYGDGSLFDRAAGVDGYGVAFWSGYPDVGAGLADQVYYGLAAPVPLFALILAVLAIAGFVRAAPRMLQTIGLLISLAWSVGLIVLFGVVEVGGNWGGDVVGVLRELTPAGIIFFLASLIVLIGTLTRFGRS